MGQLSLGGGQVGLLDGQALQLKDKRGHQRTIFRVVQVGGGDANARPTPCSGVKKAHLYTCTRYEAGRVGWYTLQAHAACEDAWAAYSLATNDGGHR